MKKISMLKILTMLVLLIYSLSAIGQKAYKYKDDNGHWIFTDKKPFRQNIETKQLDKKVQWIQLVEEKQQGKSIYYAYNKIPAPVELKVSLTKSNNAETKPVLPANFSILKGKSVPLFEVTGVEKNKPYSWTYHYQYVLGSRLNKYQDIVNYLPPIKGKFKITQSFNGKMTHFEKYNKYAVDIAMPEGTPIYAARAGKVILVDDDFYKNTYGTNKKNEANKIIILHDDGSMAIYAHLELEKAKVYPEMNVQAGDLIGYSGNTGYSSAPHLHFAIMYNHLGEETSVPFKFLNSSNQAEIPIEGSWLIN